jgi:putative oxidoreductase
MIILIRKWAGFAPQLLSILRIIAAAAFMLNGTLKLFTFPVAIPGFPPPPLSELWIAGVLETFGGALLLLGLFTRPVAFILAGEMAVAYFQGHFPQGFWPMLNNGQPAMLFSFIWLYFSAAGAGPWSLDAKRREQ